MKRLPLIIGLVLGLSAIGFAIYGATILWGVVAAFRDWGAEDTSNLPQAPLSEVLSEDLTTVDFLVFHDGPRGWYLVDDPAPFGDTEIGFYGRRFLGHLTNTGPSPNYCKGDTDAKIIWAVRDGQEVAAMAYCNVSRMDFAPLQPHAKPVTLTDAKLTEAEIASLRAKIAADPARRFVDVPPEPRPFTHARALRPPMLWADPAEADTAITEAIRTAMSGAPHATRVFNDRVNYTSFDHEDHAEMVWGSYIVTDSGTAALPGLYLYAPYVEVSCAPQDCIRLDGLDLAPAVAPMRPEALLSEAVEALIPMDTTVRAEQSPRDPGTKPYGLFIPTEADLADRETRLAATQPYTTRVRHIAPRRD
ncbi:hypothetical protein [Vannielia litorea]|uniref:hypothetical protein n=1 Tax=Vannielia litorea TaxID=1217970 RepID=UPI001BCDBF1C|nr:hypothetical protein [Vannielia litorea]MBS8227697.1 hypothetical protein [Vannielia litorea]